MGAAELAVVLDQALRRVGPSECLEVHRQEGQVEEHVAVAEAVLEGQAVQDAGPVRQAVDVVGEEVPVTVHDQTVPLALLQQLVPPVEIGHG